MRCLFFVLLFILSFIESLFAGEIYLNPAGNQVFYLVQEDLGSSRLGYRLYFGDMSLGQKLYEQHLLDVKVSEDSSNFYFQASEYDKPGELVLSRDKNNPENMTLSLKVPASSSGEDEVVYFSEPSDARQNNYNYRISRKSIILIDLPKDALVVSYFLKGVDADTFLVLEARPYDTAKHFFKEGYTGYWITKNKVFKKTPFQVVGLDEVSDKEMKVFQTDYGLKSEIYIPKGSGKAHIEIETKGEIHEYALTLDDITAYRDALDSILDFSRYEKSKLFTPFTVMKEKSIAAVN